MLVFFGYKYLLVKLGVLLLVGVQLLLVKERVFIYIALNVFTRNR